MAEDQQLRLQIERVNAEPERVYLDRPPVLPRVYTIERSQYVEVRSNHVQDAFEIARSLPETAWKYQTGSMMVIGYEDEVCGDRTAKERT